ncbi:ras-like protein family member 11B [Oppia nitens]|uniref:ras-like protein family member 11B n=1 Tax=Oppia nitens TaxID=1686743 RepID=UPI0023DAFC28|nr:ras-like protein family member 11B [Oppia nitens]
MTSSSPTSSSSKVLKRKKSSLSELKITILGDRNVGKSALVVRYLTRRYIMEYEHNIDNRHKYEILIDGEPIIFDILDSSSPSSLCIDNIDISSQTCDLLVLMYSITDRQSFIYAKDLLKHFAQQKSSTGTSIPLIAIVGNKSDLVHLRQVSVEEGEILCTEYSELTALYYGEVSVADQLVHQLFIDLFRWVKKNKVVHKSLTPSLLDRVVIGIKGSTGNGSAIG